MMSKGKRVGWARRGISFVLCSALLFTSSATVLAQPDDTADNVEIYASDDAVISNVPAEVDHNPVNSWNGAVYVKAYNPNDYERTILVKFDLQDVDESLLDQSALKLYPITADGGFSGLNLEVSIFEDEEWDETSVTWNERPDQDRTLVTTYTIDSVQKGSYISVSLGDALKTYTEQNPDAESVSFTLEVADSTVDKDHCGIQFASKDCSGSYASYAENPIALSFGEGAAAEIQKINMVETETVQNTVPSLPETVTAVMSDGSRQEKAVEWDNMTADQFVEKGMVFVNGSVEGTSLAAQARVNVLSTLDNKELTEGTSSLIPVVDGDFTELYHPNPETVGSYVNDHSVIQNRQTGEWHTIGISHLGSDYSGNEVSFAHGVSDSLSEPMKEVPASEGGDDGVVLEDPSLKPGRVAWAPHIVYVEEEQLYYMFYRSDPNGEGADHTQDLETEIACATSPDLFNWTNLPMNEVYLDKAGNKTTICFRDCNIQYFEGRWIMYYTGYHEHTSMGDSRNLPAVRMFVSDDLITWEDAGSALDIMPGATTTGWSTAESPFVFEKDGTYYLSVTVTDSGAETYHDSFIFKSNDPMNFGSWNGNPNDLENNPTYVTRISAHAPEYIVDDGQMYVTSCGWPGLTRYTGSDGGVGIAKIKWVEEKPSPEDLTESAVDNHSFETGDLTGWTAEGTAFQDSSVKDDTVFTRGSYRHRDQAGQYYLSSYPSAGDGGTGTLTSNTFVIGGDGQIKLMAAGGNDINNEYVALVDAETGEELFKVTGRNSNNFFEVNWDASPYIGKECYIQLVDNSTSGWGNICADSIIVPQGEEPPEETEEQYAFADEYGQEQGPAWRYRWMDKDTGEFGDMTWSSGNSRWEESSHSNHWMRIFSDGLMSGNDGCSAVIEWTAPKDGTVLITAGAIEGLVGENEIAMELERTDRDGATMSVEHNGETIWGGCSTLNNRKHLAFDPLRVSVKEGDTIRFIENGDGGNQEYNNDRVYWNPVVTYETEDTGVLLGGGQMISGGQVSFDVENLEQVCAEDVEVYASVNGAPRAELEVSSASVEDGKLTVSFAPVTEADAQVHLSVVTAGTSAMVTYNTTDYPSEMIEITAGTVGEGGSISPEGTITVQKGDSVTFTLTPDEGYELYRLWVNGEQQDIEKTVKDGKFTLEDVQESVEVKAAFYLEGEKRGTTYYVDAKDGDDSNEGTSEDEAWKSLEKVNATTFQPGDKILLKAGCTWNGYLWPKGEGDELDPITLGKYGDEDSYPIINGNGTMPYDWNQKGTDPSYTPAVMLYDQSYWVIEDLEVTNNFDTTYNQVGILIWTTGRNGETKDVTVQDCYVHDVTAVQSSNKLTGGIIGMGSDFGLDGNPVEGEIQAEYGFDGLYIINNHVKNVQKEGVRTSGSGEHFRNTQTHEDVVFRGNYIEDIYGDGIVLAEVGQEGLVESNVVKNACNVSEANYAGAWSWQSSNTVYRYNEVFGIEYGYNDGEAFDFDIGCSNHAFVYNYSHNNKGGLLLTMYHNPTYTFAYNISANDGKPSQELFHCEVGNEYIYNNTIYVGKGVTTHLFNNGNVGFFKNNIVLVHGELLDLFNGSGTLSETGVTNNIFYPAAITSGISEEVLANNTVADPLLPGASLSSDEEYALSSGLTYQTMGQGEEWLDGFRERASIFKLAEDSPAIDAGTEIEDPNFTFTEDLFGNPVSGAPDIGAHEFSGDAGPVDDDVKKPESIRLDQNDMYLLTGDKQVLAAEVGPVDALDTSVVFESSDPDIAEVSADGTVTGISEGTAVITVRANADSSIKAECTVHVYQRNGMTVTAVQDGYVRDNGNNAGTADNIFVKNDSVGWRSMGLVRFDLSGVDAEFVNAALQFYVMDGKTTPVEATLFDVSGQAWDEATMTWDNAPVGGDEVAKFSVDSSDNGQRISIDLTEYLKNKLEQGETEVSFRIEVTGSSGSNSQFTLGSRENPGNEPIIVFSNDSVVSVESVRVDTAVGKAPVLPETIKAVGIDGETFDAAVTWDEIDPDKYAEEGQFTVTGRIDGYSMPVVATVRVSDTIIVSAETAECFTPAGIAPQLPETVTVTYITGETGEAAVVWDVVSEESYAVPGSFEVKGFIEGYSAGTTAVVTVTDAVAVSAEPVSAKGLTGYEPLLPVQVQTEYSDGSVHDETVVWDAISPELWKKDGTFETAGTTKSGLEVICTVTMYTAVPEEGLSIENPQGKYPALPRTVVLTAGEESFEMAAAWQPVKAEDYNGTEDFTVEGVVAGTKIPVSVTVHQTEPIATVTDEVTAIEDVKIQASPSDSNFAGEPTINVKNTTYDKAYKRDSIVKFDLSGVEGGWQNLSGLTLKLYLTDREDYGTESYLSIWVSGSNWSEETATWDSVTQSGYKIALLAENVPVRNDQEGSYVEFDVTGAIPYIENGLVTFALGIEKNPAENLDGSHSGLMFASEESGEATAPKLEYTNRYITSIETPSAEVEQGCLPELPETVQVTFSDGQTQDIGVSWDAVTYSMFSESGTVYVAGTASDLYTTVTAEVTVKSSPADKAHLNDLIAQAEGLRKDEYTAESWAELQAALQAAKEVQADENASQQETDDAAEALEQALQNLEKIPSDPGDGTGGDNGAGGGSADNGGAGQKDENAAAPTGDAASPISAALLVAVSAMILAAAAAFRRRRQ